MKSDVHLPEPRPARPNAAPAGLEVEKNLEYELNGLTTSQVHISPRAIAHDLHADTILQVMLADSVAEIGH